LASFGFNGVAHIGATADRLSPKPEDFDPSRSRVADITVREAANRIFATDKFSGLRTVNVTRGVNEAFLIRTGAASPYKYFSEKSLSVGELAVLKLLRKITSVPHHSLVLIDELEMALHPSAQANLFFEVKRLAKERNLVAVFSTHSATLVKLAKQNQILWLDEVGGVHEMHIGPQKSVVLGAIAGGEERATDRIFLVEDAAAEALVDKVMRVSAETLKPSRRPKYRIVKAGSWVAAIDLYRAFRAQNDSISRAVLLLDGDVHQTILSLLQQNYDHPQGRLYMSEGGERLNFSYTPECLLPLLIRRNAEKFTLHLRSVCNDGQLNLPNVLVPNTDGTSNRDEAKVYFSALRQVLESADVENPAGMIFEAIVRNCKEYVPEVWAALKKRIH